MAKHKFTNNAKSKLAGALTNVATSLSVTATEGALFPILGAGEWFMATLVKLVSGLPVYEIIKVTARSGDTFTMLRAQDGTTATTFSAGDIIELRVVAVTLNSFAQQDGDNTYTAANDFTGASSVTMPTVAPSDSSFKAAYTSWVRGYAATKGANSDITSITGLTTMLAVNQGGTGANAGPAACVNLGAVQQGTGVGQGADLIKLGWGNPSGGLRFTLNTTDFGYIPLSSTNPNSGGAITLNNPLINAQKFQTTGNVAVVASVAQYGHSATGGAQIIGSGSVADVTLYDRNGVSRLEVNTTNVGVQNGTVVGLGASGYFQVGLSNSLNTVHDFNKIQARNNGAAATLNLNSLGGLVQVGSGGLASTGNVTGANVTATGGLFAESSFTAKINLKEGATSRGWIGADSGSCFVTINADNTLLTSSIDNSGNFTATGNVTAFSDERLKENWRDLPEDFLDRLADINLLGIYDRTDTLQTELGMSAQQVQAFAPWLVHVHPETGILSLDYGRLGAVAAARLAQVARNQRREIALLKEWMEHVMHKLGAA